MVHSGEGKEGDENKNKGRGVHLKTEYQIVLGHSESSMKSHFIVRIHNTHWCDDASSLAAVASFRAKNANAGAADAAVAAAAAAGSPA